MSGEAIIAAVLGLVGGGGVPRLWRALSPVEREQSMSSYYRGVIKDLRAENEELLHKIEQLNGRVQALETAQDLPPGHLG